MNKRVLMIVRCCVVFALCANLFCITAFANAGDGVHIKNIPSGVESIIML